MYIYNMSKNRYTIIILLVFLFVGNKTLIAQNNQNQKQVTNLIQPPYLKAGDTVAIVAPSGILKNRKDEVEHAKQLLKRWQLNVVVGEHVFSQDNHFAGTDQERCEDLQNALDNPNIKAIWCARGGYGTVRILDKLLIILIVILMHVIIE